MDDEEIESHLSRIKTHWTAVIRASRIGQRCRGGRRELLKRYGRRCAATFWHRWATWMRPMSWRRNLRCAPPRRLQKRGPGPGAVPRLLEASCP